MQDRGCNNYNENSHYNSGYGYECNNPYEYLDCCEYRPGPPGCPGPVGPRGLTGPTGPSQGPTGPASNITGPTGSSITGPTGQAITGPTGIQGVIGPTGPSQGPTGPIGPAGTSGFREGFGVIAQSQCIVSCLTKIENLTQGTGGWNSGLLDEETGIATIVNSGIYILNANLAFEWNCNECDRLVSFSVDLNAEDVLAVDKQVYIGNDIVTYHVSGIYELQAGDEICLALHVSELACGNQLIHGSIKHPSSNWSLNRMM